MATTTQRLSEEHPYWGVGVALIVISLAFIAFGLGVLARCGGGNGVCFDPSTHGTSDAALVGFFLMFVVGVGLTVYSEGTVTSTRTETPPAPPTQINVTAAPAPAAPTTTFVVAPQPASPPPTSVTVVTPR